MEPAGQNRAHSEWTSPHYDWRGRWAEGLEGLKIQTLVSLGHHPRAIGHPGPEDVSTFRSCVPTPAGAGAFDRSTVVQGISFVRGILPLWMLNQDTSAAAPNSPPSPGPDQPYPTPIHDKIATEGDATT
jgi:hypothetical protein